VVRERELLRLAIGIVFDDHLERVEHCHAARRLCVQVLAHAEFQQVHVDHAVVLRYPDPLAEVPDRLRRIPAPPHARDGGHPRVVPAVHELLLHELQELPLAHDRVGEVEPGELDLLRMVHAQLVEVPVVERPVVFEFKGADGVGDAFEGVGEAVGEVVHGVDAPVAAGAVMVRVQYAVDDRIAHVEVGGGHVDFCPERPFALLELAVAHALEEVQVFLDAAAPEGAFLSRLGERAPVLSHLFRALVADIGLSFFNEFKGIATELSVVVGGVEEPVVPVKAQPPYVSDDGVDVFDVFLHWVGVVHPQVAQALVVGGDLEVQAYRLGVADVQIPVGLRREAGVDLGVKPPDAVVLVDDGTDEVNGFLGGVSPSRFILIVQSPGISPEPFVRHVLLHR